MELSRVIIGSIVTEKSERLKSVRVYSLKVHEDANKVEVKKALEHLYDVQVSSVRIQRVGSKRRSIGAGKFTTKRHPVKKAMVTLAPKSKALDLAKFSS